MLPHFTQFFINLIYGIHYIIGPIAIKGFGPLGVVSFRVFFTTILLGIIQKYIIREKVTSLKDYGHLALCGLFGVSINMECFFLGLAKTTAINASLLMIVTPIFVLIISGLFAREKITFLKLAGILMGASGAFLLMGGKNFQFSGETLTGDIFIIVNAISYAIFLVIVKPLTKKYNSFTISFWMFVFGSVINVPVGLIDLIPIIQHGGLSLIRTEMIWSLVFVIVFVTLINYVLTAWTLQKLSSSVVGSYIYLQPVIATFLAIWLGTDQLTLVKCASGLLIFGGVFLVNKRNGR
ncbi:MAG: hypothetical protein A3G23_11185 [Bacteroidetes bacterium RIFCSPLOWO2_12_FULL_37_12]|nr:MAG: hypothetical protein A3G23_11185 [Bacteroidetes bacterium RIFCSPLOWO2_12_FULL_37_12]